MDLSSKQITVAGGNGFLGSHIIEGLVERGVPRSRIVIPDSRTCDLRIWENCMRAVDGSHIVFDAAAVVGDLLSRPKIPGAIFYDNLVMGVQLIEAARQAGAEKIITIGSAVEYPETAPSPFSEVDLWMGPLPRVNLSYGSAKKMLLVQGQAYFSQYGLPVVHLMPTNMYGPYERPESGYLVPAMIQKVLDAKKVGASFVDAWGTGEPVRDFLYVGDAVEAILLAAEQCDVSEAINLGTGEGVSVRELFARIAAIVGYNGEVKWDVSKPNGPFNRIMDTTRAEKLLGFTARTSLDEGLRKTIKWHLEHQSII